MNEDYLKEESQKCVVVQTGPSNLSIDPIDNFATSTHQDLKTDIQIKGTYTTGENVAIWNGRKLVVYEITGDKSTIRAAGTFSTESTICSLYEQNVYTIEQGKVQVRTFQGTVKQLISFTEVEGQPVTLEVCSPHFLIVGTENGIIKLFDLSRREAKQIGTAKNMTDVISHFGGFVSLRCNCAGNKVSLCIKKPNGSTDSKLYIWNTELDTLQYFNFETGKGEQDDFAPGTMESDQETAEERRAKPARSHKYMLFRPGSHKPPGSKKPSRYYIMYIVIPTPPSMNLKCFPPPSLLNHLACPR
ncbi:unnamed protein product [Owenia fusiformis]|uniref:IFT140 second beta-propeller domain-containing protein n=1 Tax=Owenia fusiformis TaxID=6347 RepID=A0A8J1UPX6_OWEFU|nr:unnamed protein product [Owenia fusiformis]